MSLQKRTRVRLTLKTITVVAGSLFAIAVIVISLYLNLGNSKESHAAAANGDFRSIASGNWTTTAIWQKYNGSSWVAAVAPPTVADKTVTIQSGTTVTVSTNYSVDQLAIGIGGNLVVSPGVTLTFTNGSGTIVLSDGTFEIYGTIFLAVNTKMTINNSIIFHSAGNVNFSTGSKITLNGTLRNENSAFTVASNWTLGNSFIYDHAVNGGTIPTLFWKPGCVLIVSGVTTTKPAGFNQVFQSIVWNCPNQTATLNFGGSFPSTKQDLTIVSTGTGVIYLDQQGNNTNLNIGRDFYFQGGTLCICINGSSTISVVRNMNVTGGLINFNEAGGTAYGNTSAQINVLGALTISGGTVNLSLCDANNSSKGVGVINLSGNFTISGTGLLTETGNSKGQIYFAGSGAVQYFVSNNNITNTIDYIINPVAILDISNYVLTGSGDFTLSSTGGIIMGHAGGITKTSAMGNVQVTGSRNYDINANYTYNGLVAQASGDGLPSQVRDLTINNGNNVTLTSSTSVSDSMFLVTGLWLAQTDTLTLGISTANNGVLSRTSGYVVGFFRRWVANNSGSTTNVLFPIGTMYNYNGANLNWTTVPSSGGSIVSSIVMASPSLLGLPLLDAGVSQVNLGCGYWNFGTMNGYGGGIWSVNLYANGFPGIADYTQLHVLRRAGTGSPWTISGIHIPAAGSIISPIGNRSAMNTWGHYGISSGSINPLPIELISFEAISKENEVLLQWRTATETNNDYFSIERSSDGISFSEIKNIPGAGNSTIEKSYQTFDNNPLSGVSYYRLKQTDFDGKFTYSEIQTVHLKIKENLNELVIKQISPNPFDSFFNAVFITNSNEEVFVELLNYSGSVIHSEKIAVEKGENTFHFDEDNSLIPGIYFCRISNGNKTAVQKLLKG